MASQYGDIRVYTDTGEKTDARLVQCPMCHVQVVPKGINDTRDVSGKTHCPNCGHVFVPGYTVATQTNPAE
jgi:predicted RNA-binding Zn-ribbon protein involved in translation (DUF1610 family)